MKKTTLSPVALAAVILLVMTSGGCGPSAKKFARFENPVLENIPSQKVLVIELKGDPKVTSGEAFSRLYPAYFRIKSRQKSFRPPAPRARWTGDPAAPDSLVGAFALPVPEDATSLPAGSDPRLKIETWPYGETAVILHKGPYADEKPTIDRLNAFIREKGYRVVGVHEEEYITPPTANPSKMLTIIRYRVERTAP